MVASYLCVLWSQRRRHFFQVGLVIQPMVGTSDHAHPTAYHWPSRREQVLSEFDEPVGVPAPGDACPLWPHRLADVLSSHAAQGWHREGGEVWQCHSNRGVQRGKALFHPVSQSKNYIRNIRIFNPVCLIWLYIVMPNISKTFKAYLVVLQVHSSPIANEGPC